MDLPALPAKADRALARALWMLGDTAALLLLLAATLHFVLPSFKSWYHDDDFRNLRWVLEYRDVPWRALTERHVLHDHIRPLTLMALWAGARLSDGAFWGPHGMLIALQTGGLLGVVALGRDLGGGWRAGVLSGLLTVSCGGFAHMTDWTAWICSAGEICFGIWGLFAAQRALQNGWWGPAAAGCMVAAGLFKEPGSVIYPLAGAALGVAAWLRGQRDRRSAGLLLLPLLGIATFVFTWSPANLDRVVVAREGWLGRADAYFQGEASLCLNGWPAWHGAASRFGTGIPLALALAVPLWALLHRSERAREAPRALWLKALGGIGMLAFASDHLAALALLGLFGAMAATRPRDPPLGFLIFLGSGAAMLPFSLPNDVRLLSGAYGLALAVGVGAAQMLEGLGGLDRVGGGVALAALLLHAALLGGRLCTEPDSASRAGQQATQQLFLGLSAVARTLDQPRAVPTSLTEEEQEALPLVGILPEMSEGRAGMVDIQVEGALRFLVPLQVVQQRLLGADLLRGQILPETGGRGRRGEPPLNLNLPPGVYGLGVIASGLTPELRAEDPCGRTWKVGGGVAVGVVLVPVALEQGCGPLRLSQEPAPGQSGGTAFLARLTDPRLSLTWDLPVPRVLHVLPTASLLEPPPSR